MRTISTATTPAAADPLFAAPFLSFDAGGDPGSLAIGDLNGDGTPDLVTANQSNTVSVLLGDGDGTFGAKTDFGTGTSPWSVAIGDLNGDGKPDLATANYFSNTVSVLLGNGDGTFGVRTDFQTGGYPSYIAIGDLDGDGTPDLATTSSESHTVSVLLGDGDGTFGAKTDFGTGTSPWSVAIGDLNADGTPDLATANSESHTVSVMLGNGDGAFGVRTDFQTGTSPWSVAIGDLNGDGTPDLATANFESHTASVLLGNGDGTFGAKTEFGTGTSPWSVAIGDLNGDGKPDLATANQSSNTVSVLLGNGDGTFGVNTDLGTGSSPRSVAIGDLNGDGTPDLATANYHSNTVSVLLGNGDGTFGAKTHFGTGSYPYSVAIGDFNGDGKPDLATANQSSNTVSVLNANGDGTFGAKTDFGTGSYPYSMAIEDLNGDGKPDLATANYFSNTVSVLLGNGDGTFGVRTDFQTGGYPSCVAIGDLNGDGIPDLATTSSESHTVSVMLGNGDGTFGAKTDFGTETTPWSVAIEDLNGDGKPDVATANYSSNTVSVLLGNGDGTFGARTSFQTGSYPSYVAIGDLDLDGTPDLVTANSGYTTVSVLLGSGDGTFGPKTDFQTGGYPGSVAIEDLNGDGKPDLATANFTSNTVSVLLGNGDGTIGVKTDFGTGNSPFSVAIGDLDGDGTFDLVTANEQSSTVSVLLNTGGGVPSFHSIIVSAGEHGGITPSGTVSVARGAGQTFEITPDDCYSIADVLVDGVSVGAVASYTFQSVTANHTIAASFLLGGGATLSAPTMLAPQTLLQTSGIKVSWTSVSGAAGYRVSRRTEGVTQTYDVSAESLEYLDYSALESTTYDYWVQAEDACGTLGPVSNAESYEFHYPVVFVHGICSDPSAWNAWIEVFEGMDLQTHREIDLRRPDGYGGFFTESANMKIEDSAERLSNAIIALGASKVNIVAHSMGGIVSRWYIEQMGGGTRVNKLIMLGTPNHGSGARRLWSRAAAGYVKFWNAPVPESQPFRFFRCLTSGEADDQLGVNTEWMRKLNYGQSHGVKDEQCPGDRGNGGPENIAAYAARYWTIAGTGSQTGVLCGAIDKRRDRWECSISAKTNDGFVSAGSVHLDALPDAILDAQGNIDDPDIMTTGHNLVDWNLVGRHLYHADPISFAWPGTIENCNESYLASAGLARQVAHLLKGEPLDQPILPQTVPPTPQLADLLLQAGVDSMEAVDLPYVNATQGAGTIRETEFVLPSSPEASFFCLHTRSGEIALRLRNPSGMVIAPNDTAGSTGLLFRNDEALQVQFFVVSNPEPGSWLMITDTGAATDSQLVSLVVQLRSNANLEATMDEFIDAGGTRLRVQGLPIESGGLVLGASLEANLVDPTGGLQAITLYDDGQHGDTGAGDGVYGALVAPSAGGGLYRADIHGTWMSNGELVARAVAESHAITPPVDLSLEPDGIVPSEAIPDSGKVISLSIAVENLGTIAADSALVVWTQEGVGEIGQSRLSVPAGGLVVAVTPWLAVGGDTVQVHASVTSLAGTGETRYDNNMASAQIALGASVVGVEPLAVPLAFELLPPRPNPTRGTTQIRFRLPVAERVDVEVFDVAGRHVCSLAPSQPLPAGEHAILWDGFTARGTSAPSGIYFIHARAGRNGKARSVVLIR